MLVCLIRRLGNTGSTGVLHTYAQLHRKLFGERTIVIGIKGINLFLIVEVIILHQCRVRSIIIDAIAGICKRDLGTCSYLILFKRKCKVECRREYVYLTVLQIAIIKIGSRYCYTVRSLSFGQEAHMTIPVITQVVHIPSHLFAFITPSLICMEIQVKTIGLASFFAI